MSPEDREQSQAEQRRTSFRDLIHLFAHESVKVSREHIAEAWWRAFPEVLYASEKQADVRLAIPYYIDALPKELILRERPPDELAGTLVFVSREVEERTGVSTEDRLDVLGKEVEDLRIRNERLRSLVAQERRVATGQDERNNQLLSDLKDERGRLDEMLNALRDMAKANGTLQQALFARHEGRLRMFESHQGVVMHVDDDSVVVTYSVNGEYVDQTYMKDQFIGGRLPERGDRLAVYVHVAELPKEQPGEEHAVDETDEQPRHRKRAIRPPREF